jgi:hypothetical protein
VDYEPETPLSFSPTVEELSDPDDRPRTPVPGQAGSSSPGCEFGVIEADDAPTVGQKRRQSFSEEEEQRRKAPKDESAASLRRGGKSVIPLKDDSVSNLSRTASGGSKPTDDKNESAAPLRKGGKSVIPAERDDLANLPTSALEGSKSSDQPDGWRFVAIRGTGSNAPGSPDGRNPRPSWPSVDEAQTGDSLDEEGKIPREYEAHNDKDKEPQQRADPFPFATPRIPKGVGQSANPTLSFEPPSDRKVHPNDAASYALPGKPNRQLTKRDLGSYDTTLLTQIEIIANSHPYLGEIVWRNDLILDNELRTSRTLTCFFLDGGVTVLQPGFSLLDDEHAWKRVQNTVFFNAIRMAWNNFRRTAFYDRGGTSSASNEQRNADVVWLEGWHPHAHIHPDDGLRMTFLHAEVLDIRARAQQLGKLLSWEEESAVVERWIENCSMLKDPSRLALGRYIKTIRQRELERQRALKHSKPTLVYKWQSPGSDLLDHNRVRCNEGPIGFALDMIFQWHKNYRFVVGFLDEMESTIAFSPLENWGQEEYDPSKPVSLHPERHRSGGDHASSAPAAPRDSSEGTSSQQRPRAQRKQAAGRAAPFRREVHPPANVNPHAPRAESGILGCDGC